MSCCRTLKLTADQAGVNTLLGRLDAADILLASYTMLDKDTRLTLLVTILVNKESRPVRGTGDAAGRS